MKAIKEFFTKEYVVEEKGEEISLGNDSIDTMGLFLSFCLIPLLYLLAVAEYYDIWGIGAAIILASFLLIGMFVFIVATYNQFVLNKQKSKNLLSLKKESFYFLNLSWMKIALIQQI